MNLSLSPMPLDYCTTLSQANPSPANTKPSLLGDGLLQSPSQNGIWQGKAKLRLIQNTLSTLSIFRFIIACLYDSVKKIY